jgi:methylated-DNA-[protein]-cysteine S-methyltransferase
MEGTTGYGTSFGEGTLVWRDGMLVAHHLPGRRAAGASRDEDINLEPASHLRLADRLTAYFSGEPVVFDLDALPLRLDRMTEFERRVARTLAATAYGEQITYARLAELSGYPRAHRAVGNFMARNPYPVLIPCHRVVRSDGSLGGFSAGAGWKEILISLEQDGR